MKHTVSETPGFGSGTVAPLAVQRIASCAARPRSGPPVYRPEPVILRRIGEPAGGRASVVFRAPASGAMQRPVTVTGLQANAVRMAGRPAPAAYRPAPPVIARYVAGRVIQRICTHPGCSDPACTDPTNHYSQKTDPSLNGFIKKSDSLVGESALKKQRTSTAPSGSDVRVPSLKSTYQRGGTGLNEGIPTDQRGKVAKSGDPVWRGLQSGMRSSTDLTPMFSPKNNSATGHSGMFPKATGRGSTNTKGQADAHDTLRVKPLGSTTQDKVSHAMTTFTSTFATGPQMVTSDGLTGALPNVVGQTAIGGVNPSGPPDASRLKLSETSHERREKSKKRQKSYSEKFKTGYCPSPEREPLGEDGTGGHYLGIGPSQRPSSPVPSFDGEGDPEQESAQASAWLTAPFRHNPQSVTDDKKCTKGHLNPRTGIYCRECWETL